jgi:hypothetical protein
MRGRQQIEKVTKLQTVVTEKIFFKWKISISKNLSFWKLLNTI